MKAPIGIFLMAGLAAGVIPAFGCASPPTTVEAVALLEQGGEPGNEFRTIRLVLANGELGCDDLLVQLGLNGETSDAFDGSCIDGPSWHLEMFVDADTQTAGTHRLHTPGERATDPDTGEEVVGWTWFHDDSCHPGSPHIDGMLHMKVVDSEQVTFSLDVNTTNEVTFVGDHTARFCE